MTGFTYDGKDYQPKMTRAGARAAEEQGLAASQLADKPFSMAPLLLFAALWSAHRLPLNKVEGMFDDLIDSGDVEFTALFEELAQEYAGLFGSGESAAKK